MHPRWEMINTDNFAKGSNLRRSNALNNNKVYYNLINAPLTK